MLTKGRNPEEMQRANESPVTSPKARARGANQRRFERLLRRSWQARCKIAAGNHRRDSIFRQRLSANYHPAWFEQCPPADDGPLLHASGRSIQAKGIEPDAVVEEEPPDEIKKAAESAESRSQSAGPPEA